MRFIRGVVIASWKLYPIPRNDALHWAALQFVEAPTGAEYSNKNKKSIEINPPLKEPNRMLKNYVETENSTPEKFRIKHYFETNKVSNMCLSCYTMRWPCLRPCLGYQKSFEVTKTPLKPRGTQLVGECVKLIIAIMLDIAIDAFYASNDACDSYFLSIQLP